MAPTASAPLSSCAYGGACPPQESRVNCLSPLILWPGAVQRPSPGFLRTLRGGGDTLLFSLPPGILCLPGAVSSFSMLVWMKIQLLSLFPPTILLTYSSLGVIFF